MAAKESKKAGKEVIDAATQESMLLYLGIINVILNRTHLQHFFL